jgi:ParB family chromosome partitioning protein
MSEKPKPICEADLRIWFHDVLELTPKEFDNAFRVIEEKDRLVLKCIAYLEQRTFRSVLDLVRSWGGNYEPAPRKEFIIPLEPALKKSESPRESTPQPPPIPLPDGTSIPVVKETEGIAEHIEKTAAEISKIIDEGRVAIATPIPMVKEEPKFQFILIDKIMVMPFQSRIAYEDPEINELVETIKQHGVLEPILVRPKNDRFEVVAGHRRLKAAKQAELTQIPAIIKPLSDQETFEIHFIENLQRKDLSDTEKARMLREMTKRYPQAYPTSQTLAQRIGKSEGWVRNLLGMGKNVEEDVSVKRLTFIKPDASVIEVQALMRVEPLKRAEAVDQIKREIEVGHVPSVRETKAIIEPEKEARKAEQPELGIPSISSAPEAPGKHENEEPEPLDVADFTCPECKQDFRIVHVNRNLHSFVPIKKELSS